LIRFGLEENTLLADLRQSSFETGGLEHTTRDRGRISPIDTVDTTSDDLVALDEIFDLDANGVTGLTNLDGTEDTRGAELIEGGDTIEHFGLLGRVRLDATNPVRVRGVDEIHEILELLLEEATDSDGASIRIRERKKSFDKLIGRRAEARLEGILEGVAILLEETFDDVGDATGVVVDNEGGNLSETRLLEEANSSGGAGNGALDGVLVLALELVGDLVQEGKISSLAE